MTNTNTNKNLQVPSPCLDEPPPPPVPPPPPPKKPLNCVQCARLLKDSPARRSGPQGPGTLCNACGLRILKRKRVARGGVKKSSRRTRANKSSTTRTQSTPNSTHPPTFPNTRHTPSASTQVPPSHPTSLQNPLQPPLFPHTNTETDPRLSPVSSAPNTVPQTPTVSCAQPSSVVNLANLHIIQPNAAPSTINPAHTQTPVHHQTRAPSLHPTRSLADPVHLQLSADAQSNNQPLINQPLISQPLIHQPPHHPIQSLSDQYTDADSASAEQMFSALQIGSSVDAGEQVSENTIDQGGFPADVFGRCDSAGTNSTQLDLVEVLEGMEVSSDQVPPGNGMIPVEGQYEDNGNVDPIAMAMGSMPMTTPPVSMPSGNFSRVMPMQSAPMPTLVMQPSDITTCMDSLATLGQMNSQITQSVSNMDIRIAALARKHEQLTQERNELSISITQLVREKNVAAKKQRQVCDGIARTTCLLHYLQKQEPFPTGA